MSVSITRVFRGHKLILTFKAFELNGVVVPPETDIHHKDFVDAMSDALDYYQIFNVYASLFDYTQNDLMEIRKYYPDWAEQCLISARQGILETRITFDDYQQQRLLDAIAWLTDPLQPEKAPKKPEPQYGYIYLIQGYDRLYKIGRAKKPVKRIESLGVKLPTPIEVIHLIPSNHYIRAESELHTRFDDKRIRGEWFDLSSGDLDYIKSIEHLNIEDMQS